MAITLADFNKIWASTSPLTPYSFSESQYKEGWNFIGGTPPSRQMWDFLQKNNDEKMQYLLNKFDNYLPLSGGSITGDVDITGDLSVSGAITGNVLTYKYGSYQQTMEWESNCIQSVSAGMATDHPDASQQYGVQVTLGKIEEGANARLYFPHNGGMYLKNFWTNGNTSGWRTMIDDKNFTSYALPKDGTAVKATADAAGNNIQNTYVKKSDLIGSIQAFAGNSLPTGWLLCDGSAVSRTDYAALYAVIGTTYGAGNGSTTFNLPNLTDKFIQGSATAGTVKSAGLPNITGSIGGGSGQGGPAGNGSGVGFLRDSLIKGCFQPSANAYGDESGSGGGTVPSGYPVIAANLDASRSSSIYGKSTTVQPPALTMRYIIKY